MPTLWIVHRDPRVRTAIARLVGAGDDAVLGRPDGRRFESAPEANAVLLGLAGDFEAELEFAHRQAPRQREAAWILLAAPADLDEVRRLFDTLDAELVAFPTDARTVRRTLQVALQRRRADPLSQRRDRDLLADRFGRWFGALDLPDLLRALDPQLGGVPILVRGETGTGRGLLVHYVHAFGGTTGGSLVHLPCTLDTTADELLAGIAGASQRGSPRHACTIWLEDVERLALPVQQRVRSWIEFSPPDGVVRSSLVRWVGTALDEPPYLAGAALSSGLGQALGAISIRVPPLRERLAALESLVADTALAWCRARGERPRRFAENALATLRSYPWPGNLRELDASIVQTLSVSAANPIRSEDLRLGGEPFRRAAAPASEDAERESAPDAERPPALVAPPAPDPGAAVDPSPSGADPQLRRLVGAIAHEIRNPLVAIRTFAELLPERYEDEEFRARFAELVGADVQRIQAVLERLGRLAELEAPKPTPVDLPSLCDALLEGRRADIEARRLVVLKELDRDRPLVLADPGQLRLAFEVLLNKVIDLVPDRGDVYLASRHHPSGLRGEPSVRALLRFRSPERLAPAGEVEGVSVSETALEFVLADSIVRAQGGTLTVDASDGDETVIVMDLPAPSGRS